MDSSSSNHMACILKIESRASGWVKSLEILLKTIEDANFTIDKRSKTVYVYGKINPQMILEKITKSGKKAEIIWSNQENKKTILENPKEHSMESINIPNGFPGYHHQQYYYPPPQHHHQQYYYPPPQYLMNQPRPQHQAFALPPPYIHQFHPQPPPPLPYKVEQSEPAAKNFPPTPPPPKNFAMGDLACLIL